MPSSGVAAVNPYLETIALARCHRCGRPAQRATKINGVEIDYCPLHVPFALVRFRQVARAALARGAAKRNISGGP